MRHSLRRHDHPQVRTAARVLLLAMFLFALLPAPAADAAGEYLFFFGPQDSYLLERLDLPSKSNRTTVYTTAYSATVDETINALAVDATTSRIYYAVYDHKDGTSRIAGAYYDGTDEQTVRTGSARSLAIHNSKLYFVSSDYRVMRCDLPSGGNEETLFTPSSVPGVVDESAKAVAVDPVGNKLYFAVDDLVGSAARIVRSDLDGGNQTTLRSGKVLAIAVHQSKLYLSENEGSYLVRRCDLPNGDNEETVYTTQYVYGVVDEMVRALAVDPAQQQLYMGIDDTANDDTNTRIARCGLSGGADELVLAVNVNALAIPGGIPAPAPSVTTGAASSVGTTTATLNGTVNANGESTTVTFEYGLTAAYGSVVTAIPSPVSGSTNTAVSKAITGLDPNKTYHFRVVGSSTNGVSNGADVEFTTSAYGTSTSLSSAPNPSTYGQSVTLTATVSSGDGTPTGSVTFYDNGVSLGTGALNGSGVATLSTSTLSVATHPVTATYGGDASFGESASNTVNQVVNKAGTSTSLSSAPNPSGYGQSVTLTATVSSAGGTPSGSVTFYDDGVSLGSASLNGSGVATLSTSTLSVTTHPITATYGGDASFGESASNTVNQVVNKAGTSTSLASAPNPSSYGQSVTLTATISSGGGTPTGNVTFYDDGVSLGTGSLNGSGVATISTSTLTVATHPITATYGGNASFGESASNTVNQVVNKAGTSTALTSAPNPSGYGQSITLTATVSSGAGTPTGSVTFYDDGVSLGTGALNGSGVATLSTSTLSVATHPITATYGGDTSFNESSSNTVSQVVMHGSNTDLVSAPNPSLYGASVTLTATVGSTGGTPIGVVTFYDGAASLGSVTLVGSVATKTIAVLDLGVHTLTATYGGDAQVNGSNSAPVNHSVLCPSTFTVISDADSGPGTLRQGMDVVCDGGTIDFDLTYPATITLTSGYLQRSLDLTISGPGSANLAISGNDTHQVIAANEALTVTGVTVRDGRDDGGQGGAGLRAWDALVLEDVALLDNTSNYWGGGAMCNTGEIHATDCLVEGNQGYNGGGLLAFTSLFMTNTRLISNTASIWGGGGMANQGDLLATNVDAIGNTAEVGGGLLARNNLMHSGGSLVDNQASGPSASDGGGAIAMQGWMDITNVSIRENSADEDGGGLWADSDVTITGGEIMTNTAGGDGGGVLSNNGVTISGTRMAGNTATGDGGGLWADSNVTITGGSVSDNEAQNSRGGFYSGGAATISGTRIISNTAGVDFGAFTATGLVQLENSLLQGNAAQSGQCGAFYTDNHIVLTNTEVLSNTAATSQGGFVGVDLALTGGAISGNEAQSSRGGFYVAGDAVISGTQMIDNAAGNDYGAFTVDGALTMTNTQVIGNTAGDDHGAFRTAGPATIWDSLFQDNWASSDYGVGRAASFQLVDTEVLGNSAGAVGALSTSGNLLATDCLLEENIARTGDRGAFEAGGDVTLVNTDLISNTAHLERGAFSASGTVSVSGGSLERNVALDGNYGAFSATGAVAITNTQVLSNAASAGYGAFWASGDVTITGARLSGNQAQNSSGGAFGTGSAVTITNTQFISNTARNHYGAFASSSGDVTIADSLIQANVAQTGQNGAFSGEAKVTLTNTDLIGNTAGGSAGAFFAGGAVTISDGLVQSNAAQGGSNGVFSGYNSVQISNSRFISNTASGSYGVFGSDSWVMINGSLFEGNAAQGGSCGAFESSGDVVLSSSQFVSNTAATDHGAFGSGGDVTATDSLFQGNQAQGGDAGAFLAAWNVTLTNTDLVSNTASGNYGAFVTDGPVSISDGLLQDNGASSGSCGVFRTYNAVALANSDVISNTAGTHYGAFLAGGAVTISDGLIERNVAQGGGKGVFSTPGKVVITASQFVSNAAMTECGAFNNGDEVVVTDSLFQGNQAQDLNCGAFYSVGDVSLTNADLVDNTAGGARGAFYAGGAVEIRDGLLSGNRAQGLSYGAFEAGADVTLANTDLISNTAANAYGAFYADGSVNMSDSLIERNRASAGGWGAFEAMGDVIVTSSRVISNTSGGSYGGFEAAGDVTAQDSLFQGNVAHNGQIGAFHANHILTISGSDVIGNLAANGRAGGILTYGGGSVTATTFVSNTAVGGQAGALYASGPLSIVGSEFVSNTAGLDGGAVYAGSGATVSDCEFAGNSMLDSTGLGGALYLGGVSTIGNSSFEANIGVGGGGAIGAIAATTISNTSVISNTTEHGGGGIAVSGAPLTMTACTVAGNVANQDGWWGVGGGIVLADAGLVRLTNCTIAENQALGASDEGGGGIYANDALDTYTQVHLSHCTVVDNFSGRDGGGLRIPSPAIGVTFHLTNTLVAENWASIGTGEDISGPVLSGGGNLVGDGTDAIATWTADDKVGSALSPLDPLVGALGDWGGDTLTVPLLPGSAAINGGVLGTGVTHDQRGVARDPIPDTGAYEARPFAIAVASGSGQETIVETPFAEPLVVDVTGTFGDPVDGGVVAFGAPFSGPSATFAPASPVTISGGRATCVASANDVAGGPYVVEARLPYGQLATFNLSNILSLSTEATFTGGPTQVCPGHNVQYTMVVSNTSASAEMTGLVVTGAIPSEAQFYGEMTPADGAYGPGSGEIVWTMPSLAAGEQASFEWTVHVISSVPSGTIVDGSARWSSDLLPGESFTTSVTVDDAGCEPAPPEDLVLNGHVFEGGGIAPARYELRTPAPLTGATVTATTCVAGAWVDVTDDDGAYTIVIPAEVADQCDWVTLTVSAPGYGEDSGTWPIADLRQDGERDFVFDVPEEYALHLPLSFK